MPRWRLDIPYIKKSKQLIFFLFLQRSLELEWLKYLTQTQK